MATHGESHESPRHARTDRLSAAESVPEVASPGATPTLLYLSLIASLEARVAALERECESLRAERDALDAECEDLRAALDASETKRRRLVDRYEHLLAEARRDDRSATSDRLLRRTAARLFSR
jgi:predicted RNase H-like nuclease (RuvC/YqgF family)